VSKVAKESGKSAGCEVLEVGEGVYLVDARSSAARKGRARRLKAKAANESGRCAGKTGRSLVSHAARNGVGH